MDRIVYYLAYIHWIRNHFNIEFAMKMNQEVYINWLIGLSLTIYNMGYISPLYCILITFIEFLATATENASKTTIWQLLIC